MTGKQVVIKNKYLPYIVYEDGTVYSVRRKKYLIPTIDKGGYLRVCLVDKSQRIKKTIQVHRLVAKAFIPNLENKQQVNHIDGNKLNNSVDNLEWNIAKENVQHAYRTGLKHGLTGVRNVMHVYDEKVIKDICELLNTGKYTNKEIAILTNTNQHLVTNIRTGVCWKEISSQYPNIKKKEFHLVKFHKFVDLLIEMGLSNKEIHKKLVEDEKLTDTQAYNILYYRFKRRNKKAK